ncbi:MAG: shikimate kinase [Lutisporaceae bacterium]
MNIVLIGFMGSGKTTIGKALASSLNMKFIDTDELIENQQGITIKDIFSNFGELRFRTIETESIKSLKLIEGHVISVGGGAVMKEDNFKTLKDIGLIVFLDAPIDKIIMNLEGGFRPLVGNTIDRDKMSELLKSRYSTYRKADIIINTDKLDVQETIEAILKSLK